ncbi:MAG: hypothetical protein NZ570_00480 [Candidatus Caldarchaeum sp.]|nr:hypothetical protein [Candidatus Caldarchaeum sp.]MCS7137207.1 hypothetical protein [Candidatus Caldarchaeum sp.]MDW7977915.1 hypothetical protein [Candidatus Caldarchaeum sp.]MDW8360604.1 hypothetical protein [Candidatus Caldarchaeum sp.]
MVEPKLFHGKRLRIAVLTADVRLAARVLDEALRRGLHADHVVKLDDIPLAAKVVVAKRGEFQGISHPSTLYADDFSSSTSLVDRAVELAYSKKEVKNVVIAVDPGKTVGAAFLADDALIRVESFTDVQRFADSAAEFFKSHPSSKQTILLGEGASEFREEIVKELLSKTKEIKPESIRLVSEKNTTKLAGGVDELAAALLPRMRRRSSK